MIVLWVFYKELTQALFIILQKPSYLKMKSVNLSLESLTQMPNKIGKVNFDQLKDMKKQFLEIQKYIDDLNQKRVEEQVKEDLLVSNFLKNLAFKDQISQKLVAQKKENLKLENQIKHIEKEIEDVIDMVKSKNGFVDSQNLSKSVNNELVNNSTLKLNDFENQNTKRKLLQTRDKLQLNQDLIKTLDYQQIDNNLEIGVSKVKIASKFKKIKEKILFYGNVLVPFKSEKKFIGEEFDKSSANLVEFIRFLFVFSVVGFVSYLYLLFNHVVKTPQKDINSLCINQSLPCLIFYSRFTNSNDSASYLLTLIIFFIAGLTLTLVYWFQTDTIYRKQQIDLTCNNSNTLSKLLLNTWRWTIKDRKEQTNTNSTDCLNQDCSLVGFTNLHNSRTS
eukprot:403374233